MRVLITGAAGQLGTDLARHCVASGDEVVALSRADLDISDRDAVNQTMATAAPQVVFNAGAWTAVDACENDVDRAYRDNALAVRWLAIASESVGAQLVHVSTDYVFDGSKATPYHEWDATGPKSVYGASKLAGEVEAFRHASNAAVVRTSWVMGQYGNNMLKTVLSLRDRPELAFVADQRGCPTFTSDLAVALRQLAAARLPGLFHLTNGGDLSWYDFVVDVLTEAGENPDKVRPIATVDLDPPRPAARPANSVLANDAWAGAGMSPMPQYREQLPGVVRALLGS